MAIPELIVITEFHCILLTITIILYYYTYVSNTNCSRPLIQLNSMSKRKTIKHLQIYKDPFEYTPRCLFSVTWAKETKLQILMCCWCVGHPDLTNKIVFFCNRILHKWHHIINIPVIKSISQIYIFVLHFQVKMWR